MSKKRKGKDWTKVGVGAALIIGTALDMIPGDELLGIPIGLGLISSGLN